MGNKQLGSSTAKKDLEIILDHDANIGHQWETVPKKRQVLFWGVVTRMSCVRHRKAT